jgi:hypothetical protein
VGYQELHAELARQRRANTTELDECANGETEPAQLPGNLILGHARARTAGRTDYPLRHVALRVWLYNPHPLTVLAARVGSYQFHPYWGLLTGLLWVRGESR